jgi:2-keto-3-deoxy-L-rhamnonate aldolase RhmA
MSASPLNGGALAGAVRSGTPTLGTFIGSASPVAAEVCAAAGVDWVLLDLGAPEFTEAIEHVQAASRRHGKACGLLVADGAAAARRLEQGWSFVAIGSDSTLLAAAVRAEFGRARTTLTEAGIPQ